MLINKNALPAKINSIKDDPQMENRWNSYRKRNRFAGDVEFKETIDAALLIIEIIYKDN